MEEDARIRVKKGTTVVAVKYGDICAIAAEEQVSEGFTVAGYMEKLKEINDYTVAGGAGSVGDIQMLFKRLYEDAHLYQYDANKIMTADVVAACLANMSRGAYGEFIVAGKDKNGVGIYLVDGAGGNCRFVNDTAMIGSGGDKAAGVLDDRYDELKKNGNVTEDDVARVAAKAIHAAVRRDLGCSGAIDLYVIDAKGRKKRYTDERIKELLEVNECGG